MVDIDKGQRHIMMMIVLDPALEPSSLSMRRDGRAKRDMESAVGNRRGAGGIVSAIAFGSRGRYGWSSF